MAQSKISKWESAIEIGPYGYKPRKYPPRSVPLRSAGKGNIHHRNQEQLFGDRTEKLNANISLGKICIH
uniref:Uncharacterized protein n=1 Tax=Romanomermis culicivorax TaxID=13658 RepID=A0A915KKX2_ROMCU